MASASIKLISLFFIFECLSCSAILQNETPNSSDTTDVVIPLEDRIQLILKSAEISAMPDSLAFLAFKEEKIFEMYGWINGHWKLLKSYPFTAFSGELGPKLRQGDRQIPEGLYTITLLNPQSTYHRSLRVSYPSDFDRGHARIDGRGNLGGDIYVHGYNATIGCIPLGDMAIEEVYSFGEVAFDKGIRIIIAPRDFRKNRDFPEIVGISWENELYNSISEALQEF